MSPLTRQSRVVMASVRLGLVTILLLAIAGSWLPSALASGGDFRPLVARTEPEGPPRRDKSVDAAPAESFPPVEQPPAGTTPLAAPPVPTQPELTQSEPTPTPEPWGPSRIALYDPMSDQSVPAGAEATFVLEVAHLGAGGPDAKEIRHDAPAGWDVRITSATNGETVYDDDDDGWVETRPLFANDLTYVAVTVTTPVGLPSTSSAAMRITANSFGADIDAFRGGIDLSVTAVVPEPTPEPTPPPTIEPSVAGPSPEPSPSDVAVEPNGSPDSSPDVTEPDDRALLAPTARDDGAGPSPSVQPSNDESNSASPPIDGQLEPSGDASADTSTNPPDSGESSPSPSAGGPASGLAGLTGSPSPGQLASPPVVVSIAADGPVTLVPGESTDVRHGFAVGGIAADQTVTLRIASTMDPAWSTLEAETVIGGPDGDLLIEITGRERIVVILRIDVPVDAMVGTEATLDVSAAIVPADPVVTSTRADAPEFAGMMEMVDAAGTGPEGPGDGGEAGSRYALVVGAVESRAALSVSGGVDLGDVRSDGQVDPTTTGVTSVADATGAIYTRSGAITVTVSGVTGSWSISCQAVDQGIGIDASRFAWRESGDAWQPFPAGNGECLRGEGPAAITIDIQYRTEWGDPIGVTGIQFIFTLSENGTVMSRPSRE